MWEVGVGVLKLVHKSERVCRNTLVSNQRIKKFFPRVDAAIYVR